MRIIKLALIGITGCGMIAAASNVQAASTSGSASAKIQQAINMTESSLMNFATILADPTGTTVTLTPAGAITASGTTTLTGTAVKGSFAVTGTPSAAVTLSFSATNALTGPGANMPLSALNSSTGLTTSFDTSGDLVFDVGATLTVNANQVGGDYVGNYTVTVDYQ